MMAKYKVDFEAKSMHQNYAIDLLNKRMIAETTKEALRKHILANYASNQKTTGVEENVVEEINAMESDSESIENIESIETSSTTKEGTSNESEPSVPIPDLNQFNAQESLKCSFYIKSGMN